MTNIVLLSIQITTNTIGAHSVGAPADPLTGFAPAIMVHHPAQTVVVTNYHLGYFHNGKPIEVVVLRQP